MRPGAAICAALLLAIVSMFAAPALAECGIASVYWEGVRTANGERFAPDGISAAHKTLPFGSRVIVRNQKTGRAIMVRINDRGPFVRGRVIDLSRGAARQLGVNGLAPVCLDVVSYSAGKPDTRHDFARDAARFFGSGVRTAGAAVHRANARVHRTGQRVHKTMRRTIRRAARMLTPRHARHRARHRR